MIVKHDHELEALKKVGRIVALAREEMKSQAKPGMSTKELDLIGKKILEEHGPILHLKRNTTSRVPLVSA